MIMLLHLCDACALVCFAMLVQFYDCVLLRLYASVMLLRLYPCVMLVRLYDCASTLVRLCDACALV